jgi:dipeptidyl aminopeptidase/acylaminoacyl peptidase
MRHPIPVLLPALMAVLAAMPARADALRTPTIDDVMRLKAIVGMEPNPVRDEVVLQVAEYDGGARFAKDLWLSVPGREPRRLTSGGRTGGSFTHAPDGTRLAFAGERGGKTGIFVLPLEGGEARLLLETPSPVDALAWVGGSLYFVAAVLPECGADLACTASHLAARADGPSAMVYTKLYHRPWNTWADGTKQALFRVPEAGGTPALVAGGTADLDVPPLPFGGREDYDVAKDGTVVYTAKAVPDPWKSTNSDLFVVEGGQARRITDNPAADRGPRFSPDGKRIAYLAQERPGFESDRWRLRVWDRATGKSVDVAASIPDWVAEFAWTPDGRSLVFGVEEQGHQPLYVVEAREGAVPRRVTGPTMNRHLALSPDGRRAVVTRESMVQPPDLYAVDLKGETVSRPAVRRTDLNREALAALKIPRVEEIRWDGAEVAPGRRQKVHGFLMLPADVPAGTRLPLVIVVHGGPQGAWTDSFHPRWNPMAMVGQGFALAMPNPTGSVGYGQDFVDAVSRDWGGKPYQDLMALLDDLSQRPDIDGARACAIGGSYGGYMANWMEAKSGNRFRCLVSHAGPSFIDVMYGTTDELWFPQWDVGGTPWDDPDNYRKVSPASYVKDFRTPMLVIQGANDFRVPLEQALFMFTALQDRGIESKLVVFPDEDHFVAKPRNRKFWYDTVTAWLKDHLK